MLKFILSILCLGTFISSWGQTHTLAGRVATENVESMSEVELELFDASGALVATYITDCDGLFTFNDLNDGETYTISMQKEDSPLNGTSTFDLVLISRELLGVQDLDSQYKQASADVDESGAISIMDLVLIRAVILNIVEEYPGGDWLFFRPGNLDASSSYEIVLTDDLLDFDIVGAKKGDVNGSADTCP